MKGRRAKAGLIPPLLINEETGEIDIGWADGEFNDGRPYRAELWSWSHLSAITLFFCTVGWENASEQEIVAFLEKEVPLQFTGSKKFTAKRFEDSSDNQMWSVSIVIQDDEGKLVPVGIPFAPYQGCGRSRHNRLLRSVGSQDDALNAMNINIIRGKRY
jgi:hypothetical protein